MAILCISFIITPQAIFSVNETGDNVTVVENDVPFSAEDLFTGAVSRK